MARRRRRARGAVPPVFFDGQVFWYTEWFDPDDDRCSRCSGPIASGDVPLQVFKSVGEETWQARFCVSCMAAAFRWMRGAGRSTDA